MTKSAWALKLNRLVEGQLGEHVIAIWSNENGEYDWYMGIIDEICDTAFKVIYLESKYKINWTFPGKSGVQMTSHEQIMWNVTVQYHVCLYKMQHKMQLVDITYKDIGAYSVNINIRRGCGEPDGL